MQALDHGRNRLCRGFDMFTQQRERDLLMIVLQAVDFGCVSLHSGADGHRLTFAPKVSTRLKTFS
jgi:hypothetical protein